MSINLLNVLRDQVSGPLAKQASSFLGESEANTMSGLDAIFPALLGSVIDKSTEPSGAQSILNMVKGVDSNMLGNIGTLFGGGASNVNGLLNSGNGILDSILGNKMGSVVDLISKVSGMKSGSSSSLLKMAAPFLLGIIGKQVSGKGLSGLTDLLMGQKKHVAERMPAGMGSILGLSSFKDIGDGLNNIKDKASTTVASTTAAASSKVETPKVATTRTTVDTKPSTTPNNSGGGMGFLKWLLPLLLIGALVYWLAGDGCNQVERAADATVETAKDAGNAVADGAKDVGNAVADGAKDAGNAVVGAANWTADGVKNVFSKVNEEAKQALDKIQFAAGSAGSQMVDFIEGGFEGDPVFRFKDLTFATGSAEIDASSQREINDVAAILKAYPNVRVRVEGHTDNVGNAENNQQLSQARAEAVKARLIAEGIDGSRLEAKGYGQAMPDTSNDTEEGRAQNRRTEIRLIK